MWSANSLHQEVADCERFTMPSMMRFLVLNFLGQILHYLRQIPLSQNYFRDIATSALDEYGLDDIEEAIKNRLSDALQKIANKINKACSTR